MTFLHLFTFFLQPLLSFTHRDPDAFQTIGLVSRFVTPANLEIISPDLAVVICCRNREQSGPKAIKLFMLNSAEHEI